MTTGQHRQNSRRDRFAPADPPDLVFEVLTAEGAEGQRLAAEQARAIKEVIEWLARRRSSNGQAPAA